jgi:conjugative relaxase-like TrwC/TraI family protein
MSLGAGFEYLMSSVVRGDGAAAPGSPLTRYYAESGTPPGRWLGAGLAGLDDGRGLAPGSVVTEEGLWRMLGLLADPITGDPLGARPPRSSTAAATSQPACVSKSAGRLPVAGFDLTFSVPKSVSVLWAIGDRNTQEVIYRAHQDAIAATMRWAEANVIFSRSGRGGAVQEDTRGVVAAAFDHWDSRAGDPHLHTHVVIANRVQTPDGRWRSLDSRTLHRYVVALSELHEGLVQDLLGDRLSVTWVERARRHSPVPRWDLKGVPTRLIDLFSRRSADIEAAKNQLVADFYTARGRQPTTREVLQLRQQATLATRPDKQHRTFAEQTAQWRSAADQSLGNSADHLTGSVIGGVRRTIVADAQLADEILRTVAATAVQRVADKRATFGEANILAEVHRQLHGVIFASTDDRIATAQRVVAQALTLAVRLTPPGTEPPSPDLRRPDGTSRLRHRGADRFTSPETLAAEGRLLHTAALITGPALSGNDVTVGIGVAQRGAGRPLGDDQAAAVHAIATSGRIIDLLVGPAGAGKTTSLAALRAAWESAAGPGSVIGMAPSATSSEVLAGDLGIITDNTAKWLTELTHNDGRRAEIGELEHRMATSRNPSSVWSRRLETRRQHLLAEIDEWSFHPGQLVVLDEASLASTRDLDALARHTSTAGAKLLLVGDWAQLDGVDAGGAFALLTRDRPDTPELREIRRFTQQWERTASTRLRVGDLGVIDAYARHDRIHSGDTRDDLLDQLYATWRADIDCGKRSMMISGDRDAVSVLNARAQAERMRTGEVDGPTVAISNGGIAATGDLIVTRSNDRRIRYGDGPAAGWVKNGDTWTVTATLRDGSLTVQRADADRATASEVALPAQYVRAHVELGYAATAHRAQGTTVDTAHALIDNRTSRQTLYVATTRARHANHLYVDTTRDPDPDTDHSGSTPHATATEILQRVLERDGAATSAHAVRRAEEQRAQERAADRERHEEIGLRSVSDRERLATMAPANFGRQLTP